MTDGWETTDAPARASKPWLAVVLVALTASAALVAFVVAPGIEASTVKAENAELRKQLTETEANLELAKKLNAQLESDMECLEVLHALEKAKQEGQAK